MSRRRASPSTDSAEWTGEECVAELLDAIRSGAVHPDKLMILWFSHEADGSLSPHRWFANMTGVEEVALLELGKKIAIEDWQ